MIIKNLAALNPKVFQKSSQEGAAVLFFIFIILAISVLTGYLLDLSTTSTFGELSSNHMERAYFMAEAGGHYANTLVKTDIELDTSYDDDSLIHNQTFVLDDAGGSQEGAFTIFVDDTDPAVTLIHSTGSINTGISSNVEVKITYSMAKTLITASPFNETLFAGNLLHLDKDVTINGDIGTNASEIEDASGVTINGEIEINAGRTLESIIFSCGGCNDDIEINGSETWPAGTYEYKNVTMDSNTTLTISGDVILYVKEYFNVEKDSTLKFLSDSSLTVYVDRWADFKKNFSVVFDPQPDRPKDFVIYGTSNSEDIWFAKDSTFIGAIYAPDAHIHIEKGQKFVGSVIGNEVHLKKETTFTYDESVKEISSPVGGGASSVTLGPPKQYFSP